MTEQHPRQDDEAEKDASYQSLGTAAEEAAKLFVAVRDRFLSDPATARLGSAALEVLSALRLPPDRGTSAGECCHCPVCQALARARAINPESVETVTAAAIQFAECVRKALGGGVPTGSEDEVRHVPLDDDSEPRR